MTQQERALLLLQLAVDEGVQEVWFRNVRAFLLRLSRKPTNCICEKCKHPDHTGELCGAEKTTGGLLEICLCAMERKEDQ